MRLISGSRTPPARFFCAPHTDPRDPLGYRPSAQGEAALVDAAWPMEPAWQGLEDYRGAPSREGTDSDAGAFEGGEEEGCE